MPLAEIELRDCQRRVFAMFMDTIATFEVIEQNAESIYGSRSQEIRDAIREHLADFVFDTNSSGEKHPEAAIFEASRQSFQHAGFYGAQLQIKERHVTTANATLRERLRERVGQFWKKPFKKWVDIINNFLGSLVSAAGVGEALKELKDVLRDELPDDEV